MSVSGIMTYACCCDGGAPPIDCPTWVNCRPQEIWITYSYSANFKEIVLPQFGATGIGGILREETESCSGNVRFIKTNGAVQNCGGLIQNPMEDYRGDFNYSKIVVQNRFIEDNDTYGPYCPDLCQQCLRIVPLGRVQVNASGNWDNTGAPLFYGDNAVISCFRCVSSGGTVGAARSRLAIFQRGNFSFSNTNYRCNGAVLSSNTGVLPNYYATVVAVGRPQCLNNSSFGDYWIKRDPLGCQQPTLTPLDPITYPVCRIYPENCDANAGPLYHEGDSINDCYDAWCVQRACYNPFPILVAGCGCAQLPACPNPFGGGPFNNGCGERHFEYTMSSSITVTNVIP